MKLKHPLTEQVITVAASVAADWKDAGWLDAEPAAEADEKPTTDTPTTDTPEKPARTRKEN